MKNLANRISAVEGARVGPTLPLAKEETSGSQKSQMPGLKPGVVIKKAQESQEHYQFEQYNPNGPVKELDEHTGQILSSNDESLEVDSKPKGRRRDARYISKSNSGQSVPVQQKLLYPDGKAIAMANVEIFTQVLQTSLKGEQQLVWQLVKSLKTNATGKWTNALPPGNYAIKVSKKGTSQKSAVEFQAPITIPNSDEPIQLKPIQAN